MRLSVQQQLGILSIINAANNLTRLGGSLMPEEVVSAMADASRHFFDMVELENQVTERLAALSHNEAACVTSGAAAGLVLSVAACIERANGLTQLPFPHIKHVTRRNVLIYKHQHNPYARSVQLAGANLVEVEHNKADLYRELGGTAAACFLYFADSSLSADTQPLVETVRVAHTMGVPVIIDAAAQIPPVSNLWYYTRDLKLDVAVFSGGKGLAGPQSTGLVVGKSSLVHDIRAIADSRQGFSLTMRAGKEGLVGLLKAVELAVQQNEAALLARYEDSVQLWLRGLADIPGIAVQRRYPISARLPYSQVLITLDESLSISRDDVVNALWERNPRIAVNRIADSSLSLNPQTLRVGEDQLVLSAIRAIFKFT